ncbi:GntR family transcriptional regulator [Clostridium sp.]|uniref:GntR family transcriptional regulator n=1 Tax=Clostridium sp. TaxID=1506 RepID=UPI003D6C9400
MFELDLRSRLPLYEQLVEKFKQLIINEVLKADEQLPSVRVLSMEITMNPNTIQKAYKELEFQGFIYSVKGKGSFVTPAAHVPSNEKLKKIKEELMKLASEAVYIGINRDELLDIIYEAEKMVKGGAMNDRN